MPQITCPHCRQPYDIPPEQWPQYQGQRINCTRCNQPFDVAGPVGPPPAPPIAGQPYPGGPPGYPPGGYAPAYGPPPKGMSGGKVALLVCGVVFLVLLVCGGGLVSVLIPSLSRAREQANRVKSANNLRQIGLAALMYANSNQNHFPDDEKAILNSGQVQIDVFVSPRTQTQTPTSGNPADWVDAHSDYAWVGAGLDSSTPGNFVMAYEKPDGLQEGIEVLFADGRVEWVPKPKSDGMVSELKQGSNPPPSLALP